ncbi:MAG: DUF6502 family protein [Pseudomonadota bacterium]
MTPFHQALSRILVPLARLAIARGMRFPDFAERAKRAYLAAAERHFHLGEKRLTDSRLHVLTGLQRRDIKALRTQQDLQPPPNAGPVARALGRWRATDLPERLALRGPPPSFEALVAQISRDIHPRTIQDELLRLGMAELDGDELRLTAEGFVPTADDTSLLGYLGANLVDHAQAAIDNVLSAPERGPHFERAAHYDHLTDASRAELDALSRDLLGSALVQINARAADLQRRDSGDPAAKGRFRAGAYLFTRQGAEEDAE